MSNRLGTRELRLLNLGPHLLDYCTQRACDFLAAFNERARPCEALALAKRAAQDERFEQVRQELNELFAKRLVVLRHE